jgi:hypothetical protein
MCLIVSDLEWGSTAIENHPPRESTFLACLLGPGLQVLERAIVCLTRGHLLHAEHRIAYFEKMLFAFGSPHRRQRRSERMKTIASLLLALSVLAGLSAPASASPDLFDIDDFSFDIEHVLSIGSH